MIKHKLSLCSQKIHRYTVFGYSNTGNLLQAYDSRLLVYYEFSHPAAPNEAFSSAGILQGMTGFKFHPITPAPHIIGRPRSKCHYYQLLSSHRSCCISSAHSEDYRSSLSEVVASSPVGLPVGQLVFLLNSDIQLSKNKEEKIYPSTL